MLGLLVTLLLVCEALPRTSFVRNAERARRRSAALKALESPRRDAPPAELWFDQRFDHFGPTDAGKTWKQRYWVDESYYNPQLPGPLFVQLGEEAEASAGMASSMAMATYGQMHGALLVAIEHRFYGKSQPYSDYSDLSLLSVDQGLADFAAIISFLKGRYNTTNTVVMGCSYIGAGASWFRAQYPNLITGAVASSAPVLAVADFFKYLDQVELSISEQFGQVCDQNIRDAFDAAIPLFKTPAFATQFNLCESPQTSDDVSTLVMSIASSAMGVVQYDFELPDNNIVHMCSVIGNASTPLQGLADFFVQSNGGQCADVSYKSFISQLANTTYTPASNMRQWTYQTCSEFGYFQTTTSPNQPFSKGDYVPLSYYEKMCTDAFGRTFAIQSNIDNTNVRLGGNKLPEWGARNVVWDNSVVDPWHTLSVQQSPNPDSPLVLYKVRGHCAAVSPPRPDDPPSIQAVRSQVAANINKWVVL